MLKILILLLFFGVVISLTSGLFFLLKDVEPPTRRTLYALGIRIALASMLLIAIFYGLYTGQLGSQAPWDRKPSKAQLQEQMNNSTQ